MTAQVFTQQIEACRAAGMDTHVAKPFTLETLLAAIARGVAASRCRVPLPPVQAIAEAAAAPPAPGVSGAHLPILDPAALDRTAAVLKPDAVRLYLRTLAGKIDSLRAGPHPSQDICASAASLADAAHALAGSAGMFGFERLVFSARHFEHAANRSLPGSNPRA